jgi:hypothetical protein
MRGPNTVNTMPAPSAVVGSRRRSNTSTLGPTLGDVKRHGLGLASRLAVAVTLRQLAGTPLFAGVLADLALASELGAGRAVGLRTFTRRKEELGILVRIGSAHEPIMPRQTNAHKHGKQ